MSLLRDGGGVARMIAKNGEGGLFSIRAGRTLQLIDIQSADAGQTALLPKPPQPRKNIHWLHLFSAARGCLPQAGVPYAILANCSELFLKPRIEPGCEPAHTSRNMPNARRAGSRRRRCQPTHDWLRDRLSVLARRFGTRLRAGSSARSGATNSSAARAEDFFVQVRSPGFQRSEGTSAVALRFPRERPSDGFRSREVHRCRGSREHWDWRAWC